MNSCLDGFYFFPVDNGVPLPRLMLVRAWWSGERGAFIAEPLLHHSTASLAPLQRRAAVVVEVARLWNAKFTHPPLCRQGRKRTSLRPLGDGDSNHSFRRSEDTSQGKRCTGVSNQKSFDNLGMRSRQKRLRFIRQTLVNPLTGHGHLLLTVAGSTM